jgi:signal peptidase II
MWLEIIFIILLVSLDQIVKYFTVLFLQGNPPLVIIENVFQLTYVENRGAAFGMLQNQRAFFLIFTAIILAIILIIYFRIPKNKRYFPLRLEILILISGSLGNYIDRFRLSYVIDTFHFSLINFPVFNVADMYVVISTFILAYLLLFYYKESELDFLRRHQG